MGYDITLVFAKGEKTKAKKQIAQNSYKAPKCPIVCKTHPVGCWIEWGQGNIIRIEYQSDFAAHEWAKAVAHAIATHFKVIKGTWSAVGEYHKMDKFLQYSLPFQTDINRNNRYIKDYQDNRHKYPDLAMDVDHAITRMHQEIVEFKESQEIYLKAAEEIFVCNPSI